MKKHIYCQHSFETEVPFFDVDAMHIVWHGNYVKYLETARCAFLSSIGYDYNEMGRQGYKLADCADEPQIHPPCPFRPKNPR